ncbi:MAG: DUF3786 domain-containing protein [bacterium]|nr:DUF3786 domain-containing protein [bacterium]
MPKKLAEQEAIARAVEKLKTVDLKHRCRKLGFAEPHDGCLKVRAFGSDLILRLSDFQVLLDGSHEAVKSGDRILLLHYLLCEYPIQPAGTLISFRDLPGGQFYWQPFLSRSIRPLVKRIGNDLESLKKNLNRFDWESASFGDFSARIHTIGTLYATLVYHLGDEEFPPGADLLFDESIKRALVTEDAAVLAGRICLSLL